MVNIKIGLIILILFGLSINYRVNASEPFIQVNKFKLNYKQNDLLVSNDVDISEDSSLSEIGFYHQGLGEYETEVVIPQDFQKKGLAFYSEIIDDADEVYFNDYQIGFSGVIPKTAEEEKNNLFRSATRQSRLYLVPDEIIKFNENNKMRICVYNISGYGGIYAKQKIGIGFYKHLYKESYYYQVKNDIFRVVILTIYSVCLIYLIINLIGFFNVKSLRLAVWKIISECSPVILKSNTNYSYGVEMIFRYIISIAAIMLFMLFIFSEVSFKYYFIESEAFWFKAPAVASFSGFTLLIILFHSELFRNKKHSSFLSKMISTVIYYFAHPFVFVLAIIIVASLPARYAWSFFSSILILYFMLVIIILYITHISLLYLIYKHKKHLDKKLQININDIVLRIFMLVGFFSSLSLFIFSSRVVQGMTASMMSIFIISFLLSSIYLYSKYKIIVSFDCDKNHNKNLRDFLIGNLKFTVAEASIANYLYVGCAKSEVLEKLNISQNTLKIHLKNIYKKIDEYLVTDNLLPVTSNANNKMSKMILFINKIQEQIKTD